MTHRHFTTLLALLLPLMAVAGVVSESEARRQALQFLNSRGHAAPQLTPLTTPQSSGRRLGQKANGMAAYYIYNVGHDEGFVVVSGDDRTDAVLGYADSGSLAEESMPDALVYWLDGYVRQLAWLDEHGDARPAQAAKAKVRSAIAPMVQTRWNQGAPYNNNCPAIDGTRTVTGCVATAMAQVMRHYQYPAEITTTLPGYTTRNGKLVLEDLSPATFDWDNMNLAYATNSTGAGAEAVATLMQYCGWSLQMNYNVSSAGGSSAYNASIADALKTCFGYDGSVAYAQRQHYTYLQWIELIYAELAARRPVILGGQAAGGGHSFVCDGYDADDYFHINWGWGGSSDGFFRLSALNPYEQGIGGSSTLDGFSFTQDAVIGIRPYADAPGATCLALEKLQFDAKGTSSSVTITRDAAEESFTGVPLYFALCSYVFGTNSFDYAVALTTASGQTIDGMLLEANDQSMTFNSDKAITTTVTVPALDDGTYYIKVLSRAAGDATWQECYDGAQQQIEAVVSAGTLTLTAPVVSGSATLPASVVFTLNGNQTQGYEQEVVATVTGGTSDYYGTLVLRVDGQAVMGKSVEIPAQEAVDVSFSFIPAASGDIVLSLWNAKTGGTRIGTTAAFAIAESDATNDLPLDFEYTIDNQTADGHLYGNAFRATVTARNPSATNSYVGQLNCSTRVWTKTETEETGDDGVTTVYTTWQWESLGVSHYPLTVGKEGSAVVSIAADDLPVGGLYSFRLTYQRVTDGGTVAEAKHIGLSEDEPHGTLTVVDGYALGDATGARTICPPSDAIDAGDACFVDLRGLSTLSGVAITPGSNPNCLYLLPEGSATPSSLAGCNVVCGTVAERLTLADGYDFYSPIGFTAAEVSYTRVFTLAANATSGWNTITLPFDVDRVECDGEAVDWFHSAADTGKNFWLKTFTGDDADHVYFDFADRMTANTPYIIAVPDDRFGADWQMTGKQVAFCGAGASIEPTAIATLSGNSFRFCGATTTQTLAEVYVLNEQGSAFKKLTAAEAQPFRAWMSAVSLSSLSMPALSIASGLPSIIGSVGADVAPCAVAVYDMQGRRLSSGAGLYIKEGKKFIRK